ncbi:hypothetical protein Pyn_12393 [Prunus yedoensis var. nudiflora]|uniref:Uncharacterized protein n=1 Tax=Prunus yedoensis var. nudiflora TaxID=2094558 RepID=A0A314ZPJ0_PRUYE|nr:hypothetical protein Pyn_12393 [Prunus yedoensis var. nudiflora]
MVAVERGNWVDKMTQLEDKIERFSEARGSPILPNLLTPPTHLSDKGSCSTAKVPDENNVEPKACNDKNLTLKNKAKCLNFTQPSIALQNLQPMPSSLKVLCRFAERTLKVAGETIISSWKRKCLGRLVQPIFYMKTFYNLVKC